MIQKEAFHFMEITLKCKDKYYIQTNSSSFLSISKFLYVCKFVISWSGTKNQTSSVFYNLVYLTFRRSKFLATCDRSVNRIKMHFDTVTQLMIIAKSVWDIIRLIHQERYVVSHYEVVHKSYNLLWFGDDIQKYRLKKIKALQMLQTGTTTLNFLSIINCLFRKIMDILFWKIINIRCL